MKLDSRNVYDEVRSYTKWPERLDGRRKRNRYDAGKAMIHVAARNVEEPNPEPYYCYQTRAETLRAVFYARVAISRNGCDYNVELRSAALSFATDRGIVFG